MGYRSRANAFHYIWLDLLEDLRHAAPVEMDEWQSQKVENTTYEVRHVVFSSPIRSTTLANQAEYQPNLPWAEDHFQERVGGEPLNPPPSEQWWPFAQHGNAEHKTGEVFSHTYPERMWPKMANVGNTRPNGRQVFVPHNGIRFEYGDLWDVVEMLRKSPQSRQAYLPIWFPEDTGAVHGERVPCSLGYHFIVRSGHLDCTYFLRSCDFFRHFRDDAYMAARLGQWVAEAVGVGTGILTMHIVSLHMFEPDKIRMQRGEV